MWALRGPCLRCAALAFGCAALAWFCRSSSTAIVHSVLSIAHTCPLPPPPPVSLSVPRPAPCPRPPSLFVAFPPRAHACVRASRPSTMVAEGDPAPDFTATDCDGASFRLSAVTPGRPVVLYFYPRSYVLVAGLCGLVGWEWGFGGGRGVATEAGRV